MQSVTKLSLFRGFTFVILKLPDSVTMVISHFLLTVIRTEAFRAVTAAAAEEEEAISTTGQEGAAAGSKGAKKIK